MSDNIMGIELEWQGYSKELNCYIAKQINTKENIFWMTDGYGNWTIQVKSTLLRYNDNNMAKELVNYFKEKINDKILP